jgi:hypothetical protein
MAVTVKPGVLNSRRIAYPNFRLTIDLKIWGYVLVVTVLMVERSAIE